MAAPCTITGTPGPDVLKGTSGNDVICGLGGDDVLKGVGGNDELNGGTGNDKLVGGPGTDVLNGDDDDDTLDGSGNNDTLNGGNGFDRVLYGRTVKVTVTIDNVADDGSTNVDAPSGSGPAADNVTTTVEKVQSGKGNDSLTGSAGSDCPYRRRR